MISASPDVTLEHEPTSADVEGMNDDANNDDTGTRALLHVCTSVYRVHLPS